MNRLDIGENLLVVLWIGGMWATGYVVAPTLFDMLDRVTAGTVAGRLFTIQSWIGLFCGVLLLIATSGRRPLAAVRRWLLVVMLAVIAAGQFGLQPMMEALKAEGLVEGSETAARFATLHGLSASLFLLNSLLGVALVGVLAAGRRLSGGEAG